MNQTYLPSIEILRAAGRTLLTAQSRWAYVAQAFINVMMIVGGGVWKGGAASEFLQFAVGVLIANLIFIWIWIALQLMVLNHPTAARLVPYYITRLRVTMLWLWGLNVIAISLLNGAVWGELRMAALAAGFSLFFLIAPFRWPLRWCLFTFVFLPWAIDQSTVHASVVMLFLKAWQGPIATSFLVVMAVMVWCLIHPRGSKYAEMHLRTLQTVSARQKGASIAEPKLSDLGIWGQYLHTIARWLAWPFALYARQLLSRPNAQASNVLAQRELAQGAFTHWVGQVEMLLGLGLVMGLWIGIKQGTIVPFTDAAMAPYALMMAALLLAIAVLPTLAMPEILRQTTTEQKLQLLLPGMPRGNTLTRLLARRQLTQAYAAWTVAAFLATGLPLSEWDRPIVICGYLSMLAVLPLVPTTDWAKLRAMTFDRSLMMLIIPALLGGGIFAMQRFCGALVVSLLAASLSVSLALLNWRWNQVKRQSQAFPADHLVEHAEGTHQ